MKELFDGLGFYPADILLPAEADLKRWSVVACDQYTSEPEYWQRVEERVGSAPSALRLILPEYKLAQGDVTADITAINRTMEEYRQQNLFRELPDTLVYVERTLSSGKTRRGLVGMSELDSYDYTPGSPSLIRATEGTVLSRIPPRVAVRKDASLELPHIMLLIDDRERTIIESLAAETDKMEQLYSFDLMENGGHIAGWRLNRDQLERVASGLRALAQPEAFAARYQVEDKPVLLFAVGDGNHSLATAKAACALRREQEPESAALAAYALTEVVNLQDDALEFEPIHRVVFGVDVKKAIASLIAAYPGAYEGRGEGHRLVYVSAEGEGCVTVPEPAAQLAVGTLQSWLDAYLKVNGGEVDYIHGEAVTRELASRPGNLGFLLPAMGKDQLFRTVICDGVLPRKTFSMGEAQDKRFYLEARAIR